MKECNECKELKNPSSYYKHPDTKDGLLGKCKECVKSRVKKHREQNIDRIRAYDRKRGSRQNEKSYLIEYRKRFPVKVRAHRNVMTAIRNGSLVKPNKCETCKEVKKVVAHHDDYHLPLCVRWLCQACHKKWHAIHGEGLNGNSKEVA